MNPNALMRDMLMHMQVVNDPNTTPPTRATHAEWLVEKFGQLDTFLVTGGFLPSRWQPPRAIAGPSPEDVSTKLSDVESVVDDLRDQLNQVDTMIDEIRVLLDEHPTWRGDQHASEAVLEAALHVGERITAHERTRRALRRRNEATHPVELPPPANRPADVNDQRWEAYWQYHMRVNDLDHVPDDRTNPDRQEDFNCWLENGQPTGREND